MKKLFFVLYACLCVGLWSCSNDDEPTVPAKQEVVVSFEDKLTEPNTSFAPTEGEDYGDWGYKVTSFTDSKSLVECNSYLGYYYFVKEDYNQSKLYWNKILEIDPGNETATKALGGIK